MQIQAGLGWAAPCSPGLALYCVPLKGVTGKRLCLLRSHPEWGVNTPCLLWNPPPSALWHGIVITGVQSQPEPLLLPSALRVKVALTEENKELDCGCHILSVQENSR